MTDLLIDRYRLRVGERVQVSDVRSNWSYRTGTVRRDFVNVLTVDLDDGLGVWPFELRRLVREQ